MTTPGDDSMADGERYLKWLENESTTVPHPHEAEQPVHGTKLDFGWLDSQAIMAAIEEAHDEGQQYGIPVKGKASETPAPLKRRIIPPKKVKLEVEFDETYAAELQRILAERRRQYGTGGRLAPLLGQLEHQLGKKLKGGN